jgi:hypothetical protein
MSKAPAVYPKLVDEPQEAMGVSPEPDALPEAPVSTREMPLLKDISAQVVVYMSGEAHKAISRYALEQSGLHAKVKNHDIILEAIQMWLDAKGLNVTARARPPAEKGRRAANRR